MPYLRIYIFIFGVIKGGGVKRQKMAQDDKIWLSLMVHDISKVFFHFFKILVLWVGGGPGVKEQKMV